MTDDESPGLGLDLPEQPQPAEASPYRVLARKYRPQTFAELIGQDAMVKTLGNAIERGRIAHAFLLTGVRGVGKTSTARLVAKALNCVGPDGQGGPTIDPCGICEPCRAIAEGRHIDVIEMDAASHTGVDDVREIIEAVRYASVSARYKIYIIDEVHMLSKSAFNALLKTLEEPPAHVKFLFATTEVNKVPVTVLSRCQRFDLRRIPAEKLAEHFAHVAQAEGVEVEEEALHAIARAAEGSARDGLSILDQAIAHGEGKVSADQVRDMLGQADRGRIRRLLETLLTGDVTQTLAQLDEAHALGIEPGSLLRGLMESLHSVTRAKAGASADLLQSAEEREHSAELAAKLSWGNLHRLWQLLLKGHEEVRAAPDPLVSAQMALLRMLHAADLPDPGALAKQLGELAARGAVQANGAGGGTGPVAALDWREVCDKVERAGMLRIASLMRDWVRVIELTPGRLVYSLAPGMADDPAADLRDALLKATGERWQAERGEGQGVPSLREQAETAKASEAERIRRAPLVEAALAAFPEAEFVEEIDAPTGTRNWSRH